MSTKVVEVEATPAMCKVVAPATLAEGSTFEATVDGRTFTATVPSGGVKEGEAFEVPYPTNEVVAFQVPAGKFQHDLCDCCNACCCPFFMGWCCTPCLLGQIMERANFNYCGCPRVNADGSPITGPRPKICLVFLILTIVFGIFAGVIRGVYDPITIDANGDIVRNEEVANMQAIVLIPYEIWTFFLLIVMVVTRYQFRRKFKIDPICCCGDNCCDDCCTTYWCACCSLIQMATHTHKKEDYKPCSRNGLRGDCEIV